MSRCCSGLPTPQCAPNFAFLMAADARAAVWRLPGVRTVTIKLQDHYTGDEINRALTRGDGFTGALPGETEDDDLSALRELFQRKTLIARQSKLCEALLAAGAGPDQIVGLCVADLDDGRELRRCLELREQLGIAVDPGAPAFVSPERGAARSRSLAALAADGRAGPREPRDQWRHLPIVTAIPPRPGVRS
jgi:hypothetical protein